MTAIPEWNFVEQPDMARLAELISDVLNADYSAEGLAVLAGGPGLFRIVCTAESGDLIGVLLAGPEEPGTVRVWFLVVHQNWQGQGLGRKAWRLLIRWAQENEYGRIILEVRISDSRAVSFYTQLGLAVERRIPDYFDTEDAFRMSVSLPC